MTLFFLHPHLQNILNLILHDRLIPDLWIFGHKALSIFRLQQGQKSTSKYVNFLLNQPEPKQMLVLFEVTWKETACVELWACLARGRGRILSTYLQTEDCVWSPWSSGNLGAWCSLQVASSSSLWAVAPGTVAHCAHTPGPYQQVTLTVTVTLGQCLMSAHSTHAHICTFIVYSSVDSCVVPLLILGWGNVIELETKVKRRFAKVSIVSYSRLSLMIIASVSQFHIYLPWAQCLLMQHSQ